MKEVAIGLVGVGTVGGGVIKVLKEKLGFFRDELNLPVRLTRVADLNAARFSELGIDSDVQCSESADDVLNDDSIRVVIELVGGTRFARTLVLEALKRGKHVVTANKALLAEFGPEIFQTATKHGASVYFEASVGGGIPIIKALREGMVANDIVSIKTIINGTCNYILSRMSSEGLSFGDALQQAQENGYAEADPTLDIGGFDTGHKVALMASLAHSGYVSCDDIRIEGISGITREDIAFARELGYTIKLLGIIKSCDGGRLDVRVHPAMLHDTHILASVSDVYNAVWIHGDAVGTVLLYGRGAGEMPTASAVVSDVIDCARDIVSAVPQRIPIDFYNETRRLAILPTDEVRARYYLRLSVVDKPGVLAGVTSSFGSHGISLAAIIQKESPETDFVPVILLTHEACERDVRRAVTEIDTMEFVRAPTQLIRIEE